jgi:hypothetical protein
MQSDSGSKEKMCKEMMHLLPRFHECADWIRPSSDGPDHAKACGYAASIFEDMEGKSTKKLSEPAVQNAAKLCEFCWQALHIGDWKHVDSEWCQTCCMYTHMHPNTHTKTHTQTHTHTHTHTHTQHTHTHTTQAWQEANYSKTYIHADT